MSISNNNQFSTDVSAKGNRSKVEQGEKRVAIFDKDGTLTCVHSLWAPWLIDTAKRLEEETGLPNLREEIYHAMGLDFGANRFVPGGLLSEHTAHMCFESIHALLERRGVPSDGARHLAAQFFIDGYKDALRTGDLVGFGNVNGIFTRLRRVGFHIAVNTSDCRVIAESTLERLGVSRLVDAVVCGDDEGIKPKPDPHTVHKICGELGVQPKNAVFIGDTPTDALCGKNSKCGLVITVLSGGIDRRLLEENSDHVVDNIDNALDLILKHANINDDDIS